MTKEEKYHIENMVETQIDIFEVDPTFNFWEVIQYFVGLSVVENINERELMYAMCLIGEYAKKDLENE